MPMSVPSSNKFQSTLPCGERRRTPGRCNAHHYFNPRSRVGSDVNFYCDVAASVGFQSTLPCGERRVKKSLRICGQNFNPRSRVGSDVQSYIRRKHRGISIHAPVWGATLIYLFSRHTVIISIHAPVWGATR